MLSRLLPLVAGLCLVAAPAHASLREGEGRVTLLGGWRLTPNDTFYGSVAKVGLMKDHDSPGGPVVIGAFGYMASDLVELAVDLFAGAEQLWLVDKPPLTSITYGAMIGPRLHWATGPFAFADSWNLYAGVLGGPTLVFAAGGNFAGTSEGLQTGLQASAGVTAWVGERWGLSLEYRVLLCRGYVPGIGSVNGGGSWFGFGVTWRFSGEREPAFHP